MAGTGPGGCCQREEWAELAAEDEDSLKLVPDSCWPELEVSLNCLRRG